MALKKIEAYEAFEIYANYDFQAPDTEGWFSVETEELAKKVCDWLNTDPRKFVRFTVDGCEGYKRFMYRDSLVRDPIQVVTSLEEVQKWLDE